MATASPTPMPAGPAPVRRTSQRQAMRRPTSRAALTRSEHQPAHAPNGHSKQYHDDSSEDEIPVPMKLSALTKALLSDGGPDPAAKPPSPPRTRRQASVMNSSILSATEERRHLRSGSMQARDDKSAKTSSPVRSREASPVRKRVVKLSHTPQSLNEIQPAKRRSTSTQRSRTQSRQESRPEGRPESRDKSSEVRPESQTDVNTPAQEGRVVRIVTGSSGNRSRIGSTGPSSGRSFDRSAVDKSGLRMDSDHPEGPDTVARNAPPVSTGSISRYHSASTRSRPEENTNLQGSMRVKRVGTMSGKFLSGPARRGRRRQSEEDAEAMGDGEPLVSSQEPGSQPADGPLASSFYGDAVHDFNSGSPVSGNAAARAIHRKHASSVDIRPGSARPSPRQPELVPEPEPVQEPEREEQAEEIPYKPKARPEMPSTHDQENEVPASYKRTKASVDQILEKIPNRPLSAEVVLGKTVSPQRKPLAAIAQNTPHRAAPPPPPKMSVLEAATSTAGAATTQAKQRRNVLKVNGKCYTRLDCLGRGGSAKVYRVTAENGKMFALKRVSLENVDELTVRGYKGEIDLLTKLSGVDRVIKLYDYEMNEEKRALTLLMEMGELDLHTLMRSRQNPESAKFDPVFVRLYWKEMLECIKSVHENDIVHSDLKPANFVLVLGRLKLIDFGIANAIQTDETVNVHRENNVGTPNYMSPESLMDSNNPRGGRMPGRPRLTKIGKPSDVWSLGCILYQMVYGTLPFAHIVNQFAKCQAIINWDHSIDFPSRAVGGVPVPPSLIRTMKRCLNRDQHMRPTCDELLHDTDPFLYPVELSDKALPIDEELLGRVIQSVVTRCRERMPTEAEGATVWPQAYWSSVRKAMANRM